MREMINKYKEWMKKEPKIEAFKNGNFHIGIELERELVRISDMSRTNSISICMTIEEAKAINKYFNKIFKAKQ